MCNIEPCYYCGLPANSVDHVVSKIIVQMCQDLGSLEVDKELLGRHRVLIVPACRECNSLLGSAYDDTLADRKKRLKDILRRRYCKTLRMRDWTEDELKELGYSLCSSIKMSMELKRLVLQRLAW